MLIALKSGNLTQLEPSGPVQACNGIALPLHVSTLYGPSSGGNVVKGTQLTVLIKYSPCTYKSIQLECYVCVVCCTCNRDGWSMYGRNMSEIILIYTEKVICRFLLFRLSACNVLSRHIFICGISFEQFMFGVPIVLNLLCLLSIDYFEAFHSLHSPVTHYFLFQHNVLNT